MFTIRRLALGVTGTIGFIALGSNCFNLKNSEKWYDYVCDKLPKQNASPAGSLSQLVLHNIYNGINTPTENENVILE